MAESSIINHEYFKINRASSDQPSMWDGYEFGHFGKYIDWKEDFLTYVAADWTVTDTGGNTQVLAAVAPALGGVLLITIANANANLTNMQKVGHCFQPTAGKNIFFECKVRANEATQNNIFLGLVITDTAAFAHTEGIGFRKDDGDTNIDFSTTLGSAMSQEIAVGTLAANTYVKLGMKITGTSLVEYYVNDVKQGELSTMIPTALLRPTIYMEDADAAAAIGAQTLSIDYMVVCQER